jgi:hypothetical protein
MKEPHEKGITIHSAPSFALAAAKCSVKRKQGKGWAVQQIVHFDVQACAVLLEILVVARQGLLYSRREHLTTIKGFGYRIPNRSIQATDNGTI